MKRALFFLFLLVNSPSVYSKPDKAKLKKRFGELKSLMVGQLEDRIEALELGKTCIKKSQDMKQLRQCRKEIQSNLAKTREKKKQREMEILQKRRKERAKKP